MTISNRLTKSLKDQIRNASKLDRQIELTSKQRRVNADAAEGELAQFVRQAHSEFFDSEQDGVFSLYIAADCYNPKVLACVAAPGARFPEAASHFLFTLPLNILDTYEVNQSTYSRYYESALKDPYREGNSNLVKQLLLQSPENNLFGDFVIREQIKSRARFVYKPKDSIEAILTVNYRNPTKPSAWLDQREQLENFFNSLCEAIPCVQDRYSSNHHDYFERFMSIRQDIHTNLFAEHLNHSSRASRKECLVGVAEGLRDLFAKSTSVPEEDIYGSIFLYDEKTRLLELAARTSNVDAAVKSEFDVSAGEGVVSWTALRGKCIRISNWQNDDNNTFRSILRRDEPVIRSQLAVPLLVRSFSHNEYCLGKQLLGVLSLESSKPNCFDFESPGLVNAIAEELAMYLMRGKERIRLKKVDVVEPRCYEPHIQEALMNVYNWNEQRLESLQNGTREYHYTPGPKFWELLGQTIDPQQVNKYRLGFRKNDKIENLEHGLQNFLDELLWEWINGASTFKTTTAITRLKEDIRESLMYLNLSDDDREIFTAMEANAQASWEICIRARRGIEKRKAK